MSRAFIFPGQGSQVIGMGQDFYDNFLVAKQTFQEIDEVLKFNLSNVIFRGPDEELTLTVNTQPALMAVSVAILNVIKEETGKDIKGLCSYVAGHSLGEYSALCSAEAISLQDTTKLLHVRGTSMQESCPPNQGAMAACIGIDITKLETLLQDPSISKMGVCQIANDNINGQIVISGHANNIDSLVAILKDSGYKAIKLKVSAPFHCDLMKPAEEKMSAALDATSIKSPLIPLICNFTATSTIDPQAIKARLVSQICGRVRWRQTLEELEKLGVTEIVEIGSGKILTGMIKKTDHKFELSNVGNISELQGFISSIK